MSDQLWYVSLEGTQLAGQFNSSQVREILQQNHGRKVHLWKPGQENWISAYELAEFSPLPPLPVSTKTCPACYSPLPQIAAFCHTCGYNFHGLPAHEVSIHPPSGIFRMGATLVATKGASLPDRCVKCNVSAGGRRLKRTVYWHHPAVYLALLSPCIYVILAMVLRKTAVIHVPLCDSHSAQRRTAILVAWVIALIASAVLIYGVSIENATIIVVGIVSLLAGIIYGVARAAMISAIRIDDRYVWLNGAGAEFLNGLGEWRDPSVY